MANGAEEGIAHRDHPRNLKKSTCMSWHRRRLARIRHATSRSCRLELPSPGHMQDQRRRATTGSAEALKVDQQRPYRDRFQIFPAYEKMDSGGVRLFSDQASAVRMAHKANPARKNDSRVTLSQRFLCLGGLAFTCPFEMAA